MNAGARNVPCVDAISTRSPCAICELRRGLWIDLNPAAPHRGRHRVRQLLQPRQVRGRPIVERRRRVRQEMERILRRHRRRMREPRISGCPPCRRPLTGDFLATGAPAPCDCAYPFFEASSHASWPSLSNDAFSISSNVFHGSADRRFQLARDLEQHVGCRTRLVQWPHHRDRRRSRQPQSIPIQGGVSIHDSRNDVIRAGSGRRATLVSSMEAAEARDEGHLCKRLPHPHAFGDPNTGFTPSTSSTSRPQFPKVASAGRKTVCRRAQPLAAAA